ncbi:MAG: tRNA pseudouridine(38-40) synthase TruA, partial [Clostridia bacterium]
NGFLYNMVRIMVGTLIKINEGAMQQEDIPLIIKSQKRKNAGVTVKPEGLYLNKVFYDKKDLMDF